MPQIYIYNYNNYRNRTFKYGTNISDYGTPVYSYQSESINFDPQDNVTKNLIIGMWNNEYAGTGDYLLYCENNVIISRWFIMEQVFTRSGQFNVTLRRDLLADNWTKVINAEMFIEKATLKDSDPLIFNQENMTFNQIKTSEQPITDETGIPWIVGYFVNATEPMTATTEGSTADVILQDLEDDEYYQYTTTNYYGSIIGSNFNYQLAGRTYKGIKLVPFKQIIGGKREAEEIDINTDPVWNVYDFPNTIEETEDFFTVYFEPTVIDGGPTMTSDYALQIQQAFTKTDLDEMHDAIGSYLPIHTNDEFNEFIASQNDVIYVQSTNKYYKRELIGLGSTWLTSLAPGIIAEKFANKVVNVVPNVTGELNQQTSVAVSALAQSYKIKYVEIQGITNNLTINVDAKKLNDAPYSMFCMPYGEIEIFDNGIKSFTTNADIQLRMATELMRKYGDGAGKQIYDLQLLPYCPARSAIQVSNNFDIKDEQVEYITTQSTGGGGTPTNVGLAIICKTSNFEFATNTPNVTINNIKIENQTDVYRVVSPNFDGQFEINAAKNGGITGFYVYCTYKPYQPFIQVTPFLSNLYGQNFKDGIGLICGGDFSLPVLTNAWESYQLQNKNYQRIFDRQIQNMQVNATINNVQSIANSAMALIPQSPLDIPGLKDIATAGLNIGANIVRQREAINYAKDQFGYQLGNIQALPNSITKVSAFVITNKIFPFLEYYTCTEQEKTAFAYKIAYNGMTVMRIGKLVDYIQNTWQYVKPNGETITDKGYIKAQVIRIDDFIGDDHELSELATELNKGIFLE